ncbi:MAG: VanZ family protein [Planctomycetaceae bacterium]|nr:VanZ family protein [Planctomycetaceae bacterium]
MPRPIIVSLFITYLLLLFYLTLFAFPVHLPHSHALLNLIPFESIVSDVHAGGRRMLRNVLGNLAVFLPMGFFVPILKGPWTSASRVALVCMILSLAIETLQYDSGRRVADIDDVLLNTLGGILGYAGFVGLRRGWSEVRSSRRRPE